MWVYRKRGGRSVGRKEREGLKTMEEQQKRAMIKKEFILVQLLSFSSFFSVILHLLDFAIFPRLVRS